MLGRLPASFSASATMSSRRDANGAVHEPVAHSASPLPCAIRSKVGALLTPENPRERRAR
jgi:hypothetical protein